MTETIPDATVSAVMRQFQARRTRVDKACAECGGLMRGVTQRRRYCSHACLQRAIYYGRNITVTPSAGEGPAPIS